MPVLPARCGTDGTWPTARHRSVATATFRCQRKWRVSGGDLRVRHSKGPLALGSSVRDPAQPEARGQCARPATVLAWAVIDRLWLHKLRRAMVRPGRDLLGRRGRRWLKSYETGVVVGDRRRLASRSKSEGGHLAGCRMSQRRGCGCERAVIPIGQTTVAHWRDRPNRCSLQWLAKLWATSRDPFPPVVDPAHIVMVYGCTRCAPLCLIGWFAGHPHHGAIDADHLDYYLDEFTGDRFESPAWQASWPCARSDAPAGGTLRCLPLTRA